MSANEGTPDFKAPPLACDAHFHVFGPAERYPYGTDLRYPPPLAPLEDVLALAKKLGIERFVFVQPSAYGRDNACMLDAMRAVGAKCRGIVDVDENAATVAKALIDAGESVCPVGSIEAAPQSEADCVVDHAESLWRS